MIAAIGSIFLNAWNPVKTDTLIWLIVEKRLVKRLFQMDSWWKDMLKSLSLKFLKVYIEKEKENNFIDHLFQKLSHVIVKINQSFKSCECWRMTWCCISSKRLHVEINTMSLLIRSYTALIFSTSVSKHETLVTLI